MSVRSWLLVVGYWLVVIFAALRPGGEIGRRTVFRWQHPKGCAGSNPVPGTIPRYSGFFYKEF